MILTDTGPLVALNDPNDSYHPASVAISQTLGDPVMLTTWQCFTEAMHFLGRDGGYYLQDRLWEMRRAGRLRIHLTTESEADRMDELMRQYGTRRPMDLADASLIAAAESLSLRRIFTNDEDFFVYRLADGSALEVVR